MAGASLIVQHRAFEPTAGAAARPAQRAGLAARQPLFLATVERGHACAACLLPVDAAAADRLGDDAGGVERARRRALPRPSGRRLLGLHRREVRLSALRLLSRARALAGRRRRGDRRGADRLAACGRARRVAASARRCSSSSIRSSASSCCMARESLGLPIVDTQLWGGIFVSLLTALVGIVFSLPLGVLLALGRRSRLPIVKARERRLHRNRARRAVHRRAVHGQEHAAAVPAAGLDPRSLRPAAGRHRAVRRRLYRRRGARRAAGDAARPVRGRGGARPRLLAHDGRWSSCRRR